MPKNSNYNAFIVKMKGAELKIPGIAAQQLPPRG
jgi:hypothetical protein